MNPNELTGYNNFSNNYSEFIEANGKSNHGFILNNGNTSNGSSKHYMNLNSNVFTYKNGK
jgi:hypothetical protein